MVQIFATNFGWRQNYPMSCKRQTHDALDLLFAKEGVWTVDNTKEMKFGEFSWKCKETMCYLWDTKPYSVWSKSTKQEIRELKKGTVRKLTWLGAPRRLWCFVCAVVKSYVHHHTHHIASFN